MHLRFFFLVPGVPSAIRRSGEFSENVVGAAMYNVWSLIGISISLEFFAVAGADGANEVPGQGVVRLRALLPP